MQLPIITCTVDGKCLPVLQASVKAYAPDIPHLIFSPKLETSAKSYDFALKIAFQEYDEVIVCADDIVLTPDSYRLLVEDINNLKSVHGDKVGLVAAHSDFTRYTQNIRYQQSPNDKLEYGKWSWEHECRPVRRLSPIFHYLSKRMYEECAIAPIEWYSDDVWCEDLNALGYTHYISRSYVHHAGSQTIGNNGHKLTNDATPWLIKNRPQYLDLFFGEGARKKMEILELTATEIVPEKKPLKICVYAISKNEEQFVKRFCESAKDADLILIADTGSTDGTVQTAKDCGAEVHSICITPWRFDLGRNASLALLPRDMDVCIMMDLDEVLEEGWREEVERCWTPEATRMRYIFDWGHGLRFNAEKIHARHGYFWHHPCHEYPVVDGRVEEVFVGTDKLLISHYPDESKSRGQYLDLLELSVKEDPYCPRNAFYYARELSFYGKWDEAIEALKRYLAMPNATWYHERCYAMRTLGKCFDAKNMPYEAESWYLRATAEAPLTREPWVALASLFYAQSRWAECYGAASRALAITHRELVYTQDPECWKWLPHDLAAISAWRLGMHEAAIQQGKLALEFAPEDGRLQDNLSWYLGEKS